MTRTLWSITDPVSRSGTMNEGLDIYPTPEEAWQWSDCFLGGDEQYIYKVEVTRHERRGQMDNFLLLMFTIAVVALISLVMYWVVIPDFMRWLATKITKEDDHEHREP